MNIAIVGTGVAAMVAAFHLHRAGHTLTVFEANTRIGGHTHTHTVRESTAAGEQVLAIDSGFIVFNPDSYPNFVELLGTLGVESQPTSMSLSVRDPRSGVTWSSEHPFAKRSNALRPRMWRMLRDLPRFHDAARRLLDRDDDTLTVDAFAQRERLSDAFVELYLLPMGAAVWSSPVHGFRDFPALFLVQFMHNHSMLQVADRPVWRTVRGGSDRYMSRLTESFRDAVRLGEPVRAVGRNGDGVSVRTPRHDERFDHVVLGCHSDQSLRVLGDEATDDERRVLSSVPYQANRAVLHTDTSHLPDTRRAWSSWNVHLPDDPRDERPVGVTYWMNRLQNLSCARDYCVTLNPTRAIGDEHVIAEMSYEHPLFTPARRACHRGLVDVQGQRRTWFCGAWTGWGFHEDAVRSGLRVAAGLGCDVDIREVPHAP